MLDIEYNFFGRVLSLSLDILIATNKLLLFDLRLFMFVDKDAKSHKII